ncbi:MAG: hypothetical protein O2845_05300 [Proteobacteria bacterium]|nr:hypothetical protein [Pseudomonadota bacterium]
MSPLVADLFTRIPTRVWTLVTLAVWGGLALLLLRQDGYGLEEGAAHALLLNWTLVDNVASPVFTFDAPDLRAVLYIPVAIYWSGSVLAAKVFTLLITFGTALLLYRWTSRVANREAALIASGLWLIAPLTLHMADSLGAGVYLVAIFALGAWLDDAYRAEPRPLGGKYFAQMVLAAISVSLHPAGLAFPLVLAWRWYKNPSSRREQRQVFIGLAIAVVLILLMRRGWQGLEWWSNPLPALAALVSRHDPLGGDAAQWLGFGAGVLTLWVLIASRRQWLADTTGLMLVAGLLAGAVAAGASWALLALTALLYLGVPRLIALNEAWGGAGLLWQRGSVLVLVVVVATLFMSLDRQHAVQAKSGVLEGQDQLLQTLVLEAADSKQPFRAASQWPARTMIVTRRDALPLPPPAQDGVALLKMMPGVTHLVFDPYRIDRDLTRNLAELGGVLETVARQEGGVILKVRATDQAPVL